MQESEIISKVDDEISSWSQKKEENGINIKFTSKAIDFIRLLIKNINDDPSVIWKYGNNKSEDLQSIAISKIPYALDKIIEPFVEISNSNSVHHKKIKVTSWEICHSLSDVIEAFCFIEKYERGGTYTEEKGAIA